MGNNLHSVAWPSFPRAYRVRTTLLRAVSADGDDESSDEEDDEGEGEAQVGSEEVMPATVESVVPQVSLIKEGVKFPTSFNGTNVRVGIIMARWNADIIQGLYAGVNESLTACGVKPSNVFTTYVPGSYEIPITARFLAASKSFDVIICLGCLIKGETMHFEYIAQSTASGIMQVSLDSMVPCIFGVLTVLNKEQAIKRSTGSHNEGLSWGMSAVEMGLARMSALGLDAQQTKAAASTAFVNFQKHGNQTVAKPDAQKKLFFKDSDLVGETSQPEFRQGLNHLSASQHLIILEPFLETFQVGQPIYMRTSISHHKCTLGLKVNLSDARRREVIGLYGARPRLAAVTRTINIPIKSSFESCNPNELGDAFDEDNYIGEEEYFVEGERPKAPPKKLVETTTVMRSGTILEVVHNGHLSFANFLRKKEDSNAIVVKLSSGKQVSLDLAQVVSVWDHLADPQPPQDPEGWAAVSTKAMDLLRSLPSRKLDLVEFWQLIVTCNPNQPVDSIDLAVYLFQEKVFKSWINPQRSDFQVYALTAAQRYVAASLLSQDKVHFKRRQSRKSWPEEAYGAVAPEDHDYVYSPNEEEVEYLVEGAYRAFSESVVLNTEVAAFEEYFRSRQAAQRDAQEEEHTEEKASQAPSILRHLRALELYSMQSAAMPPPQALKLILRRLGQPTSPMGARALLVAMKHASGKYALRTGADTGVASADTGPGENVRFQVAPWQPSVLEAAQKLSEDQAKRRAAIAADAGRKYGKRGFQGRIDLRANAAAHPVLCVDAKSATFFDDAFSLCPETGELLVHIVDVVGALRTHPALQQTAKERISSEYLPNGAIHMFPPKALEALTFSSKEPNEAITAAFTIDYATGSVVSCRVFPSVIGPVVNFDIDQANRVIDAKTSGRERVVLPIATEAVKDLELLHDIVSRMINNDPWLIANVKNRKNLDTRVNKKTGVMEIGFDESTPAHHIINACLSLYSNATYHFCGSHQVPTPVAFENRDSSVNSSVVRRFAAHPLRNWISQQQQRQVRAVFGLDSALSSKECALAVMHHNTKKKQSSQILRKGKTQLEFDRFESYYLNRKRTVPGEEPEFEAMGVGRGGIVRIVQFGVNGVLSSSLQHGESAKVRVRGWDKKNLQVLLDLA
eukprot:gene27982-33790_t